MTKVIWKFPLLDKIEMPAGAEVLSVQMQHGQACLWAVVDPAAQRETRRFCIHGTGSGFDHDHGRFVGTFQMDEGALLRTLLFAGDGTRLYRRTPVVWHLFEAA